MSSLTSWMFSKTQNLHRTGSDKDHVPEMRCAQVHVSESPPPTTNNTVITWCHGNTVQWRISYRPSFQNSDHPPASYTEKHHHSSSTAVTHCFVVYMFTRVDTRVSHLCIRDLCTVLGGYNGWGAHSCCAHCCWLTWTPKCCCFGVGQLSYNCIIHLGFPCSWT